MMNYELTPGTVGVVFEVAFTYRPGNTKPDALSRQFATYQPEQEQELPGECRVHTQLPYLSRGGGFKVAVGNQPGPFTALSEDLLKHIADCI